MTYFEWLINKYIQPDGVPYCDDTIKGLHILYNLEINARCVDDINRLTDAMLLRDEYNTWLSTQTIDINREYSVPNYCGWLEFTVAICSRLFFLLDGSPWLSSILPYTGNSEQYNMNGIKTIFNLLSPKVVQCVNSSQNYYEILDANENDGSLWYAMNNFAMRMMNYNGGSV